MCISKSLVDTQRHDIVHVHTDKNAHSIFSNDALSSICIHQLEYDLLILEELILTLEVGE